MGDLGVRGLVWWIFFFLLILGSLWANLEHEVLLTFLNFGLLFLSLVWSLSAIAAFFIFFSSPLGDRRNTRGDFGLTEGEGVTWWVAGGLMEGIKTSVNVLLVRL